MTISYLYERLKKRDGVIKVHDFFMVLLLFSICLFVLFFSVRLVEGGGGRGVKQRIKTVEVRFI